MNEEEIFAAGVALKSNGDHSGAIRLLLPLAEKHLASAALYVTLGGLYMELDQLDEALPYFNEGITIAPTSEVASLGLFHCLWAMDRKGAALGEIKRLLSVKTSDQYKEILDELADEAG